jgi:hypothetical protein
VETSNSGKSPRISLAIGRGRFAAGATSTERSNAHATGEELTTDDTDFTDGNQTEKGCEKPGLKYFFLIREIRVIRG